MNRAALRIAADDTQRIKEQALEWAYARPGAFVFLDSCGYEDRYGEWEWLVAVGGSSKASVSDFGKDGRWLFGQLMYDETLDEAYADYVHREGGRGYGTAHFFEAEAILGMRPGAESVAVFASTPHNVWREVMATPLTDTLPLPSVRFAPALSRQQYIHTVGRLREHIAAGDCYEINFCNERVAEAPVKMDALSAYRRLRAASPSPFSAFVRQGGMYTICASPERFLCGWERRIISQPMKGTAPRGRTELEDAERIAALHAHPKERAENVMIVDLVRSDLARICMPGSIAVEELFGIQTFPAVHQMVSTVSGRLRDDQSWWDAVSAAFPMGSMTGAPKEMVMRLIRRYESMPRGRFSGSIGYVTPDGDFDFNVVIRSVFYDEASGRLSYNTGGAITWWSDAEAEWEETLLKGEAIERLFSTV